MSKEEENKLYLEMMEIKKMIILNRDMPAGETWSRLLKDIKTDISGLKEDIKELKECTANTPIINKAVFTLIGIIVVGVVSAFVAIVVAKFNSVFLPK